MSRRDVLAIRAWGAAGGARLIRTPAGDPAGVLRVQCWRNGAHLYLPISELHEFVRALQALDAERVHCDLAQPTLPL